MIESYDFGKIKIDGKIYTHDLIIYPSPLNKSDGVLPDEIKEWWRDESHWVVIDDLKEVVEKKPKVLVIGTGYSGLMSVAEETEKFLDELGIKVIIEPTKKACDTFNKLSSENENVIAALHLTC